MMMMIKSPVRLVIRQQKFHCFIATLYPLKRFLRRFILFPTQQKITEDNRRPTKKAVDYCNVDSEEGNDQFVGPPFFEMISLLSKLCTAAQN